MADMHDSASHLIDVDSEFFAPSSATMPAENKLWCGVIEQAFVDMKATGAQGVIGATAATWLVSNSKDFKQVCEMAGVHADTIRAAAREYLASRISCGRAAW